MFRTQFEHFRIQVISKLESIRYEMTCVRIDIFESKLVTCDIFFIVFCMWFEQGRKNKILI